MRILLFCVAVFPLLAWSSENLSTQTTTTVDISEKPAAEKHAGFSGDVVGAYNWGTYSSPGEADNTHAGAAMNLALGYRFSPGLNLSAAAGFSLPQISVPGALETASFQSRDLGVQAGWLILDRFEPYLNYFPYARLTQTTNTRLGTASVQTELAYQGMAFGGGAKVYLTQRNSGAVQVGLKVSYLREIYNRAHFHSELQNDSDHPSPSFTPTSSDRSGQPLVSGNTYQLGLFIGI